MWFPGRKAIVKRIPGWALKAINSSLRAGEQGEGAKAMWSKLVKFMDGKKRYTAFLVLAWPTVLAAIGEAASRAGLNPRVSQVVVSLSTGAIMVALHWINRATTVLDDLTPNGDGKPK